jgi:micrococcal nuclease
MLYSVAMNRRAAKKIAYLLASLLVLTVYFAEGQIKKFLDGPRMETAEISFSAVERVPDGDTLNVIYKGRPQKARLIGIDAPELGQRPWGQRAKKRLEGMVAESGGKARIELDIETHDKYGRLLAYVWGRDGRLMNLRMVEEGFALIYTFPPNVKYVDLFRAAQKRARDAKRGVWGPGGLRERPAKYRERTR